MYAMTDYKPTERALALLAVLRRTPGRWLDRNEIAAAEDKSRLNPNDIKQLQNLADAGYIEMKQDEPDNDYLPYKWVYRVTN